MDDSVQREYCKCGTFVNPFLIDKGFTTTQACGITCPIGDGVCLAGTYTDLASGLCEPCPTGAGQYVAATILGLGLVVGLIMAYRLTGRESAKLAGHQPTSVEIYFGDTPAARTEATEIETALAADLDCGQELIYVDGVEHYGFESGDRVLVRAANHVHHGRHGTVAGAKDERIVVKIDGHKETATFAPPELRSHRLVIASPADAPALVYVLTTEWLESDAFLPDLVQLLAGRAGVDLSDAANARDGDIVDQILRLPYLSLDSLRSGCFFIVLEPSVRESSLFARITDTDEGLGFPPEQILDDWKESELSTLVAQFLNDERASTDFAETCKRLGESVHTISGSIHRLTRQQGLA